MDSVSTGKSLALWRVPCKSWSCPKCAKKKSISIAHKARINFQNERVRFLTLTIKPQGSIPEAILSVNRAWNLLRLKITRKYGKVKYFKVLEPQPRTKMPHFHVLLNKYVSATWLNHAVTSSGFGPIFKIKAVRDEHVFNYVIKYLHKGILDDDFLDALLLLKGRRYSFSNYLFPWEPSSALHPVSLHNTGCSALLGSLLKIRWFKISISSGYYPLSINDNIVLFFNRADVPLLPAPPASGHVRPAALNVRA